MKVPFLSHLLSRVVVREMKCCLVFIVYIFLAFMTVSLNAQNHIVLQLPASDTASYNLILSELIKSPDSGKMLSKAAEKAGYRMEPMNATEAYFEYLRSLSQSEEPDVIAKISKKLIEKLKTPEQIPAKCAALELYTLTAKDEAIPEIILALKSSDAAYREAALLSSACITSPKMDKELIKIGKNAPIEVKTEIIRFFGAKKDQSLSPYILELMGNRNALPLTRIALLDILAQKKAVDCKEFVFRQLPDANVAVRQAAYDALKQVVTKEDLNTLSQQLNDDRLSDDQLVDLQDALYTAVCDSVSREKRFELVLDLMKNASCKESYFHTLALIGGQKGLEIVSHAYDEGNKKIRMKAFDALVEWNGAEAAPKLFAMAESFSSGLSINKALTGYVSKVEMSDSNNVQKLLLLRKALDMTESPRLKMTIINQIAGAGTFLGLVTAGNYLDDWSSEVQQAAVQAVLSIALSHEEYSGEKVKSLLERAVLMNESPQAKSQKQAVQKYLASISAGSGFVSLFNGKDLSGWKGSVENPIARSKMRPSVLSDRQQRANDIMRRDWMVEKGVLVFDGKGYENLCTEKLYGDFELYVDWRINPKGDAGIYLRGTPQVQICDTAMTNTSAKFGSGGLHNNQKNPNKPLIVADNPAKEWNSFYIKMIGEKVTVYLNGQLVTDNVTLENYWDRKQPVFPFGEIELQAHGSHMEYRDIYIKEIPRQATENKSESETKEELTENDE